MKTKNNSALHQLLKDSQRACTLATNVDELKAVIDGFVRFPYALQFDNRLPTLALSVSLLAAGVLGFLIYNSVNSHPSPVWFSPLVFVGALCVWVIFSRRKLIINISEQIEAKAMRFLYKMTPSSPSFYNQQIHLFKDFDRGNYSSELEKCFELELQCAEHRYQAHTFTHHYVDEEETTSTDSKGNITTHTEYIHYYRQGIIIDHASRAHSMLISEERLPSYWEESFQPASMQFQKLFHVQGHNELELAKLLEPSTVLILEQAGKDLRNLSVELSPEGSLLLNYECKDLLDVKMRYDIRKPELFASELFKSSYAKLDYLLGFATQLLAQLN